MKAVLFENATDFLSYTEAFLDKFLSSKYEERLRLLAVGYLFLLTMLYNKAVPLIFFYFFKSESIHCFSRPHPFLEI